MILILLLASVCHVHASGNVSYITNMGESVDMRGLLYAKPRLLTECQSSSGFNPSFTPTNLTRMSYGQSHASTLRNNNDTVIAYTSKNAETTRDGKWCLRTESRPHVKICKRTNNKECTTVDLCSITTNYPNSDSSSNPTIFDIVASDKKIYVLASGISSLVIYVCDHSFDKCTFIDTGTYYGRDFVSTYRDYLYVTYSDINDAVHLLTCDDGSCTDKTVTSIPTNTNQVPFPVPKVVNGILYIFTVSLDYSSIGIYVCNLKGDGCKMSYAIKGLGYLGVDSTFNVLTLGKSHYIAYHDGFGYYNDLSIARCDININGSISTCSSLHGDSEDKYNIGYNRPSIAYASNLDAVVAVSTVISGNKDVAIFVANTRMAPDGISSFAAYSTDKYSTNVAAYHLTNMDETTGIMKMAIQGSLEVDGTTMDLYLYDISMFRDCIQLHTPAPVATPKPTSKPTTAGARDMPIHYASFTTSHSINQISTVISGTAASRTSNNKRVAVSDPLTAALERVKNYRPPKSLVSANSRQRVDLTPNKRSTLAYKSNVQDIVSLASMTHAWLADDKNAKTLQKSIATSPSVKQVELDFSKSLSGFCRNINRYSNRAVSPTTRQYCCDAKGKLPSGNSALICNSKIRKDINAYVRSDHAAPVFSNIANKKSNVNIQPSPRRKILNDKSYCSPTDLSNLLKGILPTVSCCFTIATNLELCIKVSGEVDVVDYTKGSNSIVIHKNAVKKYTYCWPQQKRADRLLHDALCTHEKFDFPVFNTTVQDAVVDVQATLCITGGAVLDYLANDLGFDGDKLCVAQLEIKYYETMKTMAFYLKAGVDIKIADFDVVVEGQLQLAYRPDLCNFVLDNYDPSIYPACNMLATHGCWWQAKDSNLEFTITLQLLGFVHESWTWPIHTKADQPNPPCLRSVGIAPGSHAQVQPPKYITQVSATFCVKSDGKDSDTTGSIKFSLTDKTVIANIPIPRGEWKKNSKHIVTSPSLNFQLTPAKFGLNVDVHIDWNAQGHDQMIFSVSMLVRYSDGGTVTHCYSPQKIPNCGGSCFLGICPTNHCTWNANPSFGVLSVDTPANLQCSC